MQGASLKAFDLCQKILVGYNHHPLAIGRRDEEEFHATWLCFVGYPDAFYWVTPGRPKLSDFTFRSRIVKNAILAFIVALTINYVYPYPSKAATVEVEVIHSRDRYQIAGSYPVLLRLKILKPWYIHGTNGQGSWLFHTVLCFQRSPGLKVKGIRFPAPERKKFDYAPDPLEVFSGDILVRATLVIGDNSPTGEQVIKGKLSYQACSPTVCMPPEDVPVTISVLIVPQGIPSTALNQDIFLSLNEGKDVQ